MKNKKKEESPVFVLEEMDLTVSDEASAGLKKFKETHTNMTPIMEELFIRAFDMCRDEYIEKMNEAVESAKQQTINDITDKYNRRLNNLKNDHNREMYEQQDKYCFLSKQYFDYYVESLKVLELAKQKLTNKINENIYLSNKLNQSAISSENTNMPIEYEYTFDFNLKGHDFQQLFDEGWEPFQIFNNNGSIGGVFKRSRNKIKVSDISNAEDIINKEISNLQIFNKALYNREINDYCDFQAAQDIAYLLK